MPQQRRPAAARDTLLVVLLGLVLAVALEGAARLAGFGDDPGLAIPAKRPGSTRITADLRLS